MSFPCSSMLAMTWVFLSSRFLKYFNLSSRLRSCSSFNAPVTSFLYRAIKGIVHPSSISLTAASTCVTLISSSSAIFSLRYPLIFLRFHTHITFNYINFIKVYQQLHKRKNPRTSCAGKEIYFIFFFILSSSSSI